MIEQIQQAAQLTAREADADKIAKLEAYFRRSTESAAVPVLLIANLLSISTGNHRELSELTPQQIKNRTIGTLVDMPSPSRARSITTNCSGGPPMALR